MSFVKCRMCGAELPYGKNRICTCEYCGTRQVVPDLENEKKETLFRRADKLLQSCRFDQAYAAFEKIATEFPDEPEAYWGELLCRYGIEYVYDNASDHQLPTFHRLSYESVTTCEEYTNTLDKSDEESKDIYRQQAEELESIRDWMVILSKSSDRYDVFICYKETDENGDRTEESLVAEDIYDRLSVKGYKVFFARRTLEDKLGEAYEPIIFSALNSAKVMLAIAFSPDNYEAIWVRNEWSRFLRLKEQNREKTLIPCYSNMDILELPEEFHGLQCQDMEEPGAEAELIRGIEKIVRPVEKGDKSAAQGDIVKNKKNILPAVIIGILLIVLLAGIFRSDKSSQIQYAQVELIKVGEAEYTLDTDRLTLSGVNPDEYADYLNRFNCLKELCVEIGPNSMSFLNDVNETVRNNIETLQIRCLDYTVTNLNELELLPNLKSLQVFSNEKGYLEDLSFLSNMDKLESLEIALVVTDYSAIADLPNLNKVVLEVSALENFDVFRNMDKLVELRLTGYTGNYMYTYMNLDGLSGLTLLEKLELPQSRSEEAPYSIDAIRNLTELRELTLNGSIADLEPLSGLHNLRKLSLTNPIYWGGAHQDYPVIQYYTTLEPLANLTELRELRIDLPFSCGDVSPLGKLESLETVYITSQATKTFRGWYPEIAKFTGADQIKAKDIQLPSE